MALKDIEKHLGKDGKSLLDHTCKTISKESLHLPGPDWVNRMFTHSDRPTPVLGSLQKLFSHGRLGGTGYMSILPVDQGIEHSAGASFAKNPIYFDSENILKLAIDGGCNAVASTLGVLGTVARHSSHQMPLLFNLMGAAIFLPLRRIPFALSEMLARLVARNRYVALLYIAGMFIVMPVVCIYVFSLFR